MSNDSSGTPRPVTLTRDVQSDRPAVGEAIQENKKENLVDQHDDFQQESPSLTTVLNVFDPDELYLYKSRRGNWLLAWNRDDNRYLDDAVWSYSTHQGEMPQFAKGLFRQVGVDVR